jgi:GrpB-like predicted nucleotidyltransferase (UPF0157 family)/GNAT superfamily N-acetyltransferase
MLKAPRQNNPKSNLIEVVPYDPRWPETFAVEAAKIQAALGANCIKVLHVGSTSVPGLCAKPVIDMVPVVKDITLVDGTLLEQLGFEGRGELGMLFRRYFSNRNCHLHVWEEGNPEIDKHLLFRNYLIAHPDELKRYEALKLSLAKTFRTDCISYTLSKDDLIKDMLQKAGFQGLTMVQALTDREWGTVKRMRQQYFFDLVNIVDPYTWTFDDRNHFHIVLMKGVDIVGYTHLQFWPDKRAALRIIVIEEPLRNKGLGHHFLRQLERWLPHQGITSFHTQSSPKACRFYKREGYVEMPFNDPDGHESDPQDIDMGKVL